MDVFVSRDALLTLSGLSLSRRPAQAGLALGHRRGGRTIVEKAVPAGLDSLSSPVRFFRLAAALEAEIVGFFFLSPASDFPGAQPPPFAAGKIILRVKRRGDGMPSLRAFVVDHAGRFILRSARVIVEKGKGQTRG